MSEPHVNGGLWGGSFSVVAASVANVTAPDPIVAHTALIFAAGGLVAALGSVGAQFVLPLIRIWIEVQQANRKSAESRHDLANQVNQLHLQVELAKKQAAVDAELAKKQAADQQEQLIEARATIATLRAKLPSDSDEHDTLAVVS